MRQKTIIVILACFMLTILCSPVFSQSNAPVVSPLPIKVSIKKMDSDDRGTDVENIYHFIVDFADHTPKIDSYNVMFYFDGRYTTEFKNVSLPYKFSWNFKGQPDGAHDVRIDLEAKDLRIVARETLTVNVKHNQKRKQKSSRK